MTSSSSRIPRRQRQRSFESSFGVLKLQASLDQHLLGFGDGFCRIQTLGANLCAVHDGVAAIELERIFKIIKALTGCIVSAVSQPPIRGEQGCGSKVTLRIPPVAWATG